MGNGAARGSGKSGLDLTSCAVTGATEGLAFVSPKTGRAVTKEAAGIWSDRLLRLPLFMTGSARDPRPEDWRDGLRLTGHFLARDLFGGRHRPLPMARQMLYDRVAALVADSPPVTDAADFPSAVPPDGPPTGRSAPWRGRERFGGPGCRMISPGI